MKVDLIEPLVLDAGVRTNWPDSRANQPAAATARSSPTSASASFLRAPTRGSGVRSGARVRILSGDVSGSRSNLRLMREMDLLCPSESELRDAYRDFDESLPSVVWQLLRDTASRHAIITMGADGLVAFDRLPDAESMAPVPEGDGFRSRLRGDHVPTLCGHAVDALGCGDALLATATLALASGAPLLPAAFLGSIAAAAQAQRLGNTVVTASDLRHGIVRTHAAHLTYSPNESARSRARAAAPLTA